LHAVAADAVELVELRARELRRLSCFCVLSFVRCVYVVGWKRCVACVLFVRFCLFVLLRALAIWECGAVRRRLCLLHQCLKRYYVGERVHTMHVLVEVWSHR
jgi:hypothetical protein